MKNHKCNRSSWDYLHKHCQKSSSDEWQNVTNTTNSSFTLKQHIVHLLKKIYTDITVCISDICAIIFYFCYLNLLGLDYKSYVGNINHFKSSFKNIQPLLEKLSLALILLSLEYIFACDSPMFTLPL